MRQPDALVRFAGRPRVCVGLFLLYGLIVLSWFGGGVSWWVGVAAIGAALRTWNAYRELQRYNAWAAEWQAMGSDDDTPSPAPQRQQATPKPGGGKWLTIAAALLVGAIPMMWPPGPGQPQALKWLWVAACLFLLWKLARKFRRKGGGSAKVAARKPASVAPVKDAAVAWLLPRASSSPSRMDAMRMLPEYSARLIAKVEHAVARY